MLKSLYLMHAHEEFPVVVAEVAGNVLRAHLLQVVSSALLWTQLLFQRGLSTHKYDFSCYGASVQALLLEQ